MLTMVRNTTGGPATFTDPVQRIELTWAGYGDPNGGDVQRVPDAVMQNPDFMRAMDRGVFEVVDTEAHQVSLEKQAEAANVKQAEDEAQIESVMDRSTEQSIVTAQVDEAGKLISEEVTERVPVTVEDTYTPETDDSGLPLTVPSDSEKLDETGKPVEGEISVVMGPRERG